MSLRKLHRGGGPKNQCDCDPLQVSRGPTRCRVEGCGEDGELPRRTRCMDGRHAYRVQCRQSDRNPQYQNRCCPGLDNLVRNHRQCRHAQQHYHTRQSPQRISSDLMTYLGSNLLPIPEMWEPLCTESPWAKAVVPVPPVTCEA